MPDPIKLSAQPVIRAVPARTRVPLLLHPADEADENKRNPTAGLRDFAGALARYGPGPNHRPDLWKEVKYYSKVDRDGDIYGGDCFEELDKDLCCQFTTILIEFYRTDSSQAYTYGQRLVAIYDGSATPQAYINRSATFDTAPGSLVPAKFVPVESPEAQHGYVRRDTSPPSITDWRLGELSIWDIGGDVFATAKQAGGLFPPFTGEEDAYWKPAAKPGTPYGYTDQQINALLAEKGDAAIQAEHTQQLATLAVQASQVYGYLQAGGAPVGFGSLNASLADPRQRVFQTFNVATLSLTASNPASGSGWAYATNAQGTTLDLAANVVLSLPGSDSGSLTFTDFYIQGARGSKVRLLTMAAASTAPALLPRLSGYCNTPLELANGGAVLLSGYYVSLLGTGTVYALPPFQADTVASGVTVIPLGGGGGGAGTSYTAGAGIDITGSVISLKRETYPTIAFAANLTLDLAASAQLLTLTNNVGFNGTTNRAQGRAVRLFLYNNTAAAVTLSFPVAWAFLGVKPATLAAGKKSVLTLECVYGSAEGDIVAGYVDQN